MEGNNSNDSVNFAVNLGEADTSSEKENVDRYVRELALHLWRKHYMKDSPEFDLLESTSGVLTQIDNMLTGLTRLDCGTLGGMLVDSGKAQKAIHILRNRHGWSVEQIRDAGLTLADEYEDVKDAYENMRDFARSKGLDTTAYSSDYFQSGVNPDSPQAT